MELRQVSLSNAPMRSNEKAKKVGAAIRLARKRQGLVMKDVAAKLGLDVAAIGNWETGRNLPSTENLLSVAQFLKVDATALGQGEAVALNPDELVNEAEVVTDPALPQLGPMDVQLLGIAVGGDDGDFSFNGEVTGHVRRPPGIAHIRNVFAVHLLSDSMVPRYDPGDLLYCGGRPPTPGDHVLIELFPEGSETSGKAFVKKYIKKAGGIIFCEQYNPPSTLEFDSYSLKNMWRIIPPRELLGF